MDDAAETVLGAAPASLTKKPGALAPGDAFGLRYAIVKELGAGGMGVVYKAWDDVLGVEVALKMIRLDGNHDHAAIADIERRFKRELLLARQVTHRNVVRIHDLGDVNGTKYITMTYVDGEDLSTILKRGGPLPVDRVMRLARQIASGLLAAHDAGVVHRDLKPANIMVDAQDQALIMDFGIAVSMTAQVGSLTSVSAVPALPMLPRLAAPAAGPAEATMLAAPATTATSTLAGTAPPGDGETMLGTSAPTSTATANVADGETVLTPTPTPTPSSGSGSRGRSSAAESVTIGQIVGTLDYMSPEQSRGEAVDQRTDIYALGWILTDLLLGKRRRAEGVTSWEAMTARISKPPVSLTTLDPKVPAPLDAIILRCVQLNAADRYEHTQALVDALSRLDDDGHLIPEPKTRRLGPLGMTLVAAGVAGLMGGTWWLAQRGRVVAHDPVSVLVADFANSADPVYSQTVEQALTIGIEGATFVTALPHRDAVRVANEIKAGPKITDATARLVAMREGVPIVIGGTITPKGTGVQIGVRAVQVADQKVLLDWSTTASNKDDVLSAVGRAAERVRRTLGDTSTGDSGAQETFTAASLDAAKAYSEAQELVWAGKNDEAITAYQKTLTLDPEFGRAHAGLAAIYANRGKNDDAETSYKSALARLDRMTEREKLRTRTGYYLFSKDYERAAEEARTLLAKFPGDTSAMANLAFAQFGRRDMKSALEMGRKASDAYPNNILRRNNAALFAMYAGDFDEGVRLGQEVLALNPKFEKAFIAIGVSQLASGKAPQAASTFERLAAVGTPVAKNLAATAQVDLLLSQGQTAEALTALDAAIEMNRSTKDALWLGRRLALRAVLRAEAGRKADATHDALEATALGKEESIAYLAGRALIDAGQPGAALDIAADLDDRLENDARLYGALLRGDAALAADRPRAAVNAYKDALKLGDAWMAHLNLGRAYLALTAFPEASAELDRCVSRRGEATAAFLDDRPTWHFYRGVPELLAQARAGLKSGK